MFGLEPQKDKKILNKNLIIKKREPEQPNIHQLGGIKRPKLL